MANYIALDWWAVLELLQERTASCRGSMGFFWHLVLETDGVAVDVLVFPQGLSGEKTKVRISVHLTMCTGGDSTKLSRRKTNWVLDF